MTILRWIGRVTLAVLALGAFAAAAVYGETERRRHRRVPQPPRATLVVRHDSATLAHGRHLMQSSLACGGCHGDDLGGRVVVDEPMVMRLVAPNLTTGRGGVLARYDDAALDAAIRHGVDPDGRVLVIMPSHEFAGVADDDLAALIAWLRAQPPVDREPGRLALGPVARVLGLAGKLHLFPYDIIDHDAVPPARAPRGESVERGRYIAAGCTGCHGRDLRGGPIAGAPPGWPPASDLTARGAVGRWSESEFLHTLRTGRRPDGSSLRAPMPWREVGRMTDEELRSLRRYLQSLDRDPSGARSAGSTQ